MKRIDSNVETTYPVYFCECKTIRELAELSVPTKYFVLLVCADFSRISISDFFDAADKLLARGLGCFCAWGPDCERAHDLFDEGISDRITKGEYISDDAMMTTWHNDQPLREALWFGLFAATVHSDHWDDCCTVVASIGSKEYAQELATHLSDIAAFCERRDKEYGE